MHLFHSLIVNEVGAIIIIIDTYGLIFVCMWIDIFFNVVAHVFDSLRSESAGDTKHFPNGMLRPPLREAITLTTDLDLLTLPLPMPMDASLDAVNYQDTHTHTNLEPEI